MEPNQNQSKNDPKEDTEKSFCDRPYEEVEDGYIDDRGFYTTPNGSFWDDEKTYFNHLGFDHHGGSYDKYGIYQPGPGYDEKTGLYKDQQELFTLPEILDENENDQQHSISKLREQEKKDEKIIKEYEQLVEESEDDGDEDKSNITFDEEDFKEAYDNAMEIENEKNNIMNNKLNIQNQNDNCNNNNNNNP
jgi:hypothetical protein